MRPLSLVLLHSPLVGPASWGRLPEALHDRGLDPLVVAVTDDDRPPYAARYVARAALQIRADRPESPIVLVAHSGAGPLLPQMGFAQRSARRAVAGYVFLDASLPRGGAPTRLEILRSEGVADAEALETLLREGGTFPSWTDDDLAAEVSDPTARAAILAGLRPRRRDFYTEAIPHPPDWPDAPCGYLRTSPTYDAVARQAAARGWNVIRRDGGHFAAATDPVGVADALVALVSTF